MSVSVAVDSLERLAQDVFEVVRLLTLGLPRTRRRPGDLKEGEFLTLSMLQDRGTMVVGEIQRELGVLPAQMSRIIRALENHEPPLVECQINLFDKRKIDVNLTDEGEDALGRHRRSRIGLILQVLEQMDDDDLEALAMILDQVRTTLQNSN